MSKIIIIGAGGVGRVVTHKCAQLSTIFTEIVLASRTLKKCDDIATSVRDKYKEVKIRSSSNNFYSFGSFFKIRIIIF